MKYAMGPTHWDTVEEQLAAVGGELTEDLSEAELLVYNGSAEDFPELPDSVKWVQFGLAGIDAYFTHGVIDGSRRYSNCSGTFARPVAESAVALLLAQLHQHTPVARAQSWSCQKQVDSATRWLFDSTVSIIGAGGIGRELVPMLKGFGCTVLAVNNSGNPVEGADKTYSSEHRDEVLSSSDAVILAAPLTDDTHHMINERTLKLMPEHAVLINVGRGPLVDSDALVDALNRGEIAGAGLDVTEPEPLPDGHPLWEMEQVVITPHTANTKDSIRRLIAPQIVENFTAYQAGETMPTEVTVDQGY
ncbi:D-isomer specific 2-hydroxyacid dehydrogenase family protein [Corynebacterium sp. TAE3-ERU30]|uniref:D-isomer specific 2-hydroxyacid dehydrogenase family protein n=1 Tax=Corynebacterium sp. TAE3-ERU30 TaxID=2849496 RepID=UPI001C473744|nr:D-isomer specific 2-hydroxyacid dehydrogenase family protein [Corynebacterium sp. TAE3-ERU30]MBV7281815.1 D-isomer specific 2-hydroxyacid dehydrogenase family protein [Corynebacterium sp. TAE3-ERU30]